MSHGLLTEFVEQADGKLGKQMTFPGCPPDWGQNNWRRRLAMRQARKERQKRWQVPRQDTIHINKRRLRVTPRLTIRHAQIGQAARRQVPSPRLPDLRSRFARSSPLLIGRGNLCLILCLPDGGDRQHPSGEKENQAGGSAYPSPQGTDGRMLPRAYCPVISLQPSGG